MARSYTAWSFALLVAAALLALHPTDEADLFSHLELGRSVLEHGTRTVPEPHAFVGFEASCMAPAWLWDVLAYGLYELGGFVALSLATLVAALGCALAVASFTRRWSPSGPHALAGWLLVSAACLISVGQRFEPRPQTLAIALLAAQLALLHAHGLRSGRARQRSGALLVALAVLWAQLHGSFVLAPVLVAIALGSSQLLAARAAREAREARVSDAAAALGDDVSGSSELSGDRRTDLWVLLGSTLALASSAAGLDVVRYIGGHGYGDAVRFIHEMRPPTLAGLLQRPGAAGAALPLLWLLGLFGVSRDARVAWAPLAFALVGHALLSRAVRFTAEDALLSAPLALNGAHNLADWAERTLARRSSWLRALSPIAAVVALAMLAHAALDARGGYGGGYGLGLERGAFPRLAAAYLSRLPAGSAVLTDFGAGPPLGFWTQRKLRTYVDGRTPLYFDDADYAVQREVFTNEDALERALVRWNVQAAVVERAHGVCDLLAKRWEPVVIEARYSTFMPAGRDTPLTGVDPCGPEYVHASALDAAALDRTIARLRRLGEDPFSDFLRAQRLLVQSPPDAAGALALLERSASPSYALPHRRAYIAASIEAGQLEPAFTLMRDALAEGDVSVLRFAFAPQMGALPLSRARELLELGVAQLGEAASPGTRSMLAAICVEQRDAACARFHGLRAAARGAPNVEPTLSWLGEHAETARMRADARAWLQLLRRETSLTRARSLPAAEPEAR
jgi:hypothetical protein